MKTTLQIDDQLLEQAKAATGSTSAEAVVEVALRRLVISLKPRKDLLDLAGKIEFRDDFDHKALRSLRNDAG